MITNFRYTFILLFTIIFTAEPDLYDGVGEDLAQDLRAVRGLGQYGYPSDPISDRAKGYLLKGKVKNAISNYGNFITWDEHPAGLWGEYSYLPHVAMVAGIPGMITALSIKTGLNLTCRHITLNGILKMEKI